MTISPTSSQGIYRKNWNIIKAETFRSESVWADSSTHISSFTDFRVAIFLSIHYCAGERANPGVHKEEANGHSKNREPCPRPDRQAHLQTRINRCKEPNEQGQL